MCCGMSVLSLCFTKLHLRADWDKHSPAGTSPMGKRYACNPGFCKAPGVPRFARHLHFVNAHINLYQVIAPTPIWAVGVGKASPVIEQIAGLCQTRDDCMPLFANYEQSLQLMAVSSQCQLSLTTYPFRRRPCKGVAYLSCRDAQSPSDTSSPA